MRMALSFPSALTMQPRHGAEKLLLAWLTITVFSSAIVIVDVIYNVMAVGAVGIFTLLGLRLDRANVPLILFLVLFNIAGLLALQPYLHVEESREFMIGTCFVGITAIFFAMLLNENALQRLEALKWGFILGALVAAITGLGGYMELPGFAGQFVMYGSRVSGTFRDPNVFGSFLVLPALFVANDILRGRGSVFIRVALFSIIALGVFLSFSRGSWIALLTGLATLVLLSALTTRDRATRARLALFAMCGAVFLVLGLTVILSVDSIYEVFADRFTLTKDYDSGPSGRFGNQRRSIPELLELPFGFGPNRFWIFYTENPHNTFLMAFASYGWMGGVIFFAFITTTIVVSIRTILLRTPFQPYAIVVFAGFVPHLIQMMQIDMDRWRHLFMIYGLLWGLAAISTRWMWEYRHYAHRAYQAQLNLAANAQPAE
jgi:hypothetical protein